MNCMCIVSQWINGTTNSLRNNKKRNPRAGTPSADYERSQRNTLNAVLEQGEFTTNSPGTNAAAD